ncbi:MAG: DUF3810 domain-containing protein [Clostridia bacterium]
MKEVTKKYDFTCISTNTTLQLLIASVIMIEFSVVLLIVSKQFTQFTDNIYAPWSSWIMNTLSRITGIVGFSIAEIFMYLMILVFLASLVLLVIFLFRSRGFLHYLFRYLTVIALIASVIFSLFNILWGCNYYTTGIDETLSLQIKKKDTSELIELNKYLISVTNELAGKVERDYGGHFEGHGFDEYAKMTASAFSEYTGKTEVIPKYIISSGIWSYTKTCGVFTCITGESNVNSNDTALSIPFTMTHEMAHRNGIAVEDEANFLAFYTLYDNEDINIRYSAYAITLIYCMQSLCITDYGSWLELTSTYCSRLIFDYDEYFTHWARYDGIIAEIFNQFDRSYLKVQDPDEKIKSYGIFTSLMLAWYEQNN